jgi:hypothetical protein
LQGRLRRRKLLQALGNRIQFTLFGDTRPAWLAHGGADLAVTQQQLLQFKLGLHLLATSISYPNGAESMPPPAAHT